MIIMWALLGIVLFFVALYETVLSAAKEGTLKALSEYDIRKKY